MEPRLRSSSLHRGRVLIIIITITIIVINIVIITNIIIKPCFNIVSASEEEKMRHHHLHHDYQNGTTHCLMMTAISQINFFSLL